MCCHTYGLMLIIVTEMNLGFMSLRMKISKILASTSIFLLQKKKYLKIILTGSGSQPLGFQRVFYSCWFWLVKEKFLRRSAGTKSHSYVQTSSCETPPSRAAIGVVRNPRFEQLFWLQAVWVIAKLSVNYYWTLSFFISLTDYYLLLVQVIIIY